MKTDSTKRPPRGVTTDRKREDWLVGLRIGLALAEGGMSEVLRRAGRIDVLDEEGRVIFSSRIDDLPVHVRRAAEE